MSLKRTSSREILSNKRVKYSCSVPGRDVVDLEQSREYNHIARQPRTEFEDLGSDLMRHILSSIPLKPRTRLKLVSMDWRDMITSIRKSTRETTSYGLLIESRQVNTNFITLRDHGEYGELSSESVEPSFHHLTLIASSNGLLLYAKVLKSEYSDFVVYSPITNQKIAIPEEGFYPKYPFLGFFYDNLKKHFMIICSQRGWNEFTQTFSSETWNWQHHHKKRSEKVFSALGPQTQNTSFYSDGKLYYQCDIYLNIYDICRNSYQTMVKLVLDKVMVPFVFVWVSEGKIWSCYSWWNMVEIRVLQGGDENPWRVIDSIDASEWYKLVPSVGDKYVNSPRLWLKPFNFNEDLQTLYFEALDEVFAYSLETKKVTVVWLNPSPGQPQQVQKIYPFLFKPVYLSHFGNRQLAYADSYSVRPILTVGLKESMIPKLIALSRKREKININI